MPFAKISSNREHDSSTTDLAGGTLDELEQVLDRELRRSFVAMMRRHVHLFAVQDADREAVEPPCRDPKDKSISGPGRRSRCSRCTCQQR
jgi:hypothetical protein